MPPRRPTRTPYKLWPSARMLQLMLNPLVPELHLGTHLSPKLRFGLTLASMAGEVRALEQIEVFLS